MTACTALSPACKLQQRVLRAGVIGTIVLFMGASIGCTTAQERGEEGIPMSPNARAYAYFIVNGMVRGSMVSGYLTHQELPALLQADREAREAIERNLRNPSEKSDFRADQLLAHYIGLIPKGPASQ
ncbi:hypothetical protein E3E11_08285 [Oecophyllibacter saccharovorans]|uniref:hypothetical protein n=2 Tax=Oecophyllibacter saccharovorans TaxID=2558360 RepID=UPI0011416580|nr:hypothetical protein [Oecophyllibacter saccharovorans]QDH15849.1 hypothetical protein E3E11_08285 [Oecophyllibacter saccharovorans]